jgi:phosphoglycolate phosphatase
MFDSPVPLQCAYKAIEVDRAFLLEYGVGIRLLIFDLDGTLIDSSIDICDALNHTIRPYGLAEVTVGETITLVGEGVARLIGKLIEQRAPDLDLPTLIERFTEYYAAHLTDHTRAYPGTGKVLQALEGRRKAVITNKHESLSLRILGALDLLKYFDYVAGGDTSPERKPSPVPILNVLSRFGTAPEEALVVGDSIYDIEAGRAAGVRTVAALYGYGAAGFSDGADYSIEQIGGLTEIVRLLDH